MPRPLFVALISVALASSSLGCVVADGASLWVDSYRALVKLER